MLRFLALVPWLLQEDFMEGLVDRSVLFLSKKEPIGFNLAISPILGAILLAR